MRADGQPATREHLLMALAQLDYLLIRATFSASTSQATLKDVAMDTATTVNTGLGRAFAVEQCSCPAGYQGLSCEVTSVYVDSTIAKYSLLLIKYPCNFFVLFADV